MNQLNEATKAISEERIVPGERASHIAHAKELIKAIPIQAWQLTSNGITLESACFGWEDGRYSNARNELSPSFLVEVDLLSRQVKEILIEYKVKQNGEIEAHEYHGEDVNAMFGELESTILVHRAKQSASTVLNLENLVKPLQGSEE